MLLNTVYNIGTVPSIPGSVDYLLTIPSGKVTSDLTNFPLYIDLSQMPNSFWSAVRPDGGNLRAHNAAKSVEYPIDVVTLKRIAKTGSIYVKIPTVAAASNTTVLISVLDNSQLGYARTATYGMNSVWSDYNAVWLGGWFWGNRASEAKDFEMIGDIDGFTRTGNPEFTFTNDPHQGVAWDETTGDVYTFDTTIIRRFNSAGTLQASNTGAATDVQTATGDSSYVHLSDGCVVGNFLVIPVNDYPTNTKNVLAIYDKTTLAYITHTVVSSIDPKSSGICWNDDLQRLVSVNWGSLTVLRKWTLNQTTGAIVFDASITLTISYGTLTQVQGIEYYAGNYWLVDDERDEVIRCDLDGKLNRSVGIINANANGSSVSGSYEGICRYKDGLLVLSDPTSANSFVTYFTPYQGQGGGGGFMSNNIDAYHNLYGLTGGTTWTMAVSTIINSDQQQSAVTFRDLSSGSVDDRATIVNRRSAGTSNNNRREVWDNLNSWISETSPTNVAIGQQHRTHVVYNGTTNRKLYNNGALKATSGAITARDVDFDTMTLFNSDESINEDWIGWLSFAYIRMEALSTDWIAAEYANINSPGTFYSVEEL